MNERVVAGNFDLSWSMFQQSVRTLPIRTSSGILILVRFLIAETVPLRRKARQLVYLKLYGGRIGWGRE
jgi:hypothetical protein